MQSWPPIVRREQGATWEDFQPWEFILACWNTFLSTYRRKVWNHIFAHTSLTKLHISIAQNKSHGSAYSGAKADGRPQLLAASPCLSSTASPPWPLLPPPMGRPRAPPRPPCPPRPPRSPRQRSRSSWSCPSSAPMLVKCWFDIWIVGQDCVLLHLCFFLI